MQESFSCYIWWVLVIEADWYWGISGVWGSFLFMTGERCFGGCSSCSLNVPSQTFLSLLWVSASPLLIVFLQATMDVSIMLLWASSRKVLFQAVLKSFVRGVFIYARVFLVLHLVSPRHWSGSATWVIRLRLRELRVPDSMAVVVRSAWSDGDPYS